MVQKKATFKKTFFPKIQNGNSKVVMMNDDVTKNPVQNISDPKFEI